nr:zf-TFIIB domain-containing protein [Desulfomonile tiedjei]
MCAVELRMAERQGVEIDYCPKCRGVWLDRGELDKIIEKSSPEQNSLSETHYGNERKSYADRSEQHRSSYQDERSDHYHGKKKKSFCL